MGRPRLEFQALLETLGALKVYFQPPNGLKMVYPCIVYNRDSLDISHADNTSYRLETRYQVTVIDRDPDNLIKDRVARLPMTTFNRFFASDDLNHDVYTVYF